MLISLTTAGKRYSNKLGILGISPERSKNVKNSPHYGFAILTNVVLWPTTNFPKTKTEF